MRAVWTTALLSLLMFAGCSSATTQPSTVATSVSPASATAPPTPASVKPGLDVCALLTSADIKAVQGEELKEAKPAGQAGGGLSTSQCFFTLPTSGNSISLVVVQKGAGADGKDPEEFWREKFHENERDERDKDRDRAGKDHDRAAGRDVERDKEKREAEGEEEEGVAPQKVAGVGREAYWVGSRVGGALYVLKGNAYLRISVGGPTDRPDQITKAKTLAQKALARL